MLDTAFACGFGQRFWAKQKTKTTGGYTQSDLVSIFLKQTQSSSYLYSLGKYVRHFSPLIGKFLGSANSPDGGDRGSQNIKATAFVANRIQLAGPIPATLRHRYVGFAPFVKAMFRRSGIRGIILHHALHKQHLQIYKWDKNVVWGVIGDKDEAPEGEEADRAQDGEGSKNENGEVKRNKVLSSDSIAMARQFLRMTSHGTHGRIFTYVIMLDGEMRFTVCHSPSLLLWMFTHCRWTGNRRPDGD
jgi:hypothetical protein